MLLFLGLIARLQLEYWRGAHGVYYAGLVTMMRRRYPSRYRHPESLLTVSTGDREPRRRA